MLQLPTDRETVNCMYCSTNITVNVAILAVQGQNVENLLTLARNAFSSGNNQEAYNYYTKILEVDSRRVEAWCGKAMSAGWMSTLRDFRLPEMVSGFTQAISVAPDSDKPLIQKQAANAINEITMACYKLAREHLAQFIQVNTVWQDYLGQCSGMLTALEQAYIFSPSDKVILENIIFLCKDNIEGVAYTDYQGISQLASLSPAYEAQLQQIMSKATWRLRKLDPTFQAPEIKKASAGCATLVLMSGMLILLILLLIGGVL